MAFSHSFFGSLLRFIVALMLLFCLAAHAHARTKKPGLEISHLTGDFYVYTTYHQLNGSPFPSNSMYMVTDKGVVMFDTPWDTTQFQPLLDSIKQRHHKEVVLCVATHFHADRTAGLDFLNKKGIPTYTTRQTYDLCATTHEPQAKYYFAADTTFVVGNHTFEAYYPGEGHTKDNIVRWFPAGRILYGGCLIKSIENQSLGFVDDANLREWGATITKVMARYPNPNWVIPGHFTWKSTAALQHTLDLVNGVEK